MVGARARVRSSSGRVLAAARKGEIRSLGHAGAAIRLVASRSIRRQKGAAPPGQPPHTHTKRLPHAIKYAVDKRWRTAVIGPDVESIGTVGRAHEHGGRFRGRRYEKRPFMGPALEKLKDRLPRFWAYSVR